MTETYKAGAITYATAMAFNWVGGLQLPAGLAVAAHAAVGCASAAASGGNCGSGALAAGFGKLATLGMPTPLQENHVYQLTYVSVVGGTASVLGGGKFGNGATTAAFGYLFNYLMHRASSAELYINEATLQADDAQEPILLAANTNCISSVGGLLTCADAAPGAALGGGGGGSISVTRSGVALPTAPKYTIPPNYVQNPVGRSGSYGEYVNGRFVERLRIDPPTPPGYKGPNNSHYHLNGQRQHHAPGRGEIMDPGFW